MELVKAVKRYKGRLAKRFTKGKDRQQLNVATDKALITILRLMAYRLECPIYVLTEHVLQLGLSEIVVLEQDKALRDQLCRHLVQDHLLTPVTKPESEPVSRRVLRIENAMNFLRLVESRATPEEQKEILKELLKKVSEVDQQRTKSQ